MGIFSRNPTGPEYDKRKAELKDLKGQKGVRKEKRQLKKLNKRERELLATTAAKAKISTIIDTGGRIVGKDVLKKIPTYKQRMAKGLCPLCGTTPQKRGHVCNDCKNEAQTQMPTSREINNTQFSKGLGVGIPNGQNMNGLMYCINGHRVFYVHAHGAYDCNKGCNGLGPAR